MGNLKLIISGGGTGGHIFPAISIANAVRKLNPDAEILFVGALGRMEMERVPMAGYAIEGLPVAGLQRKISAENLKLPFKLIKSNKMAKGIVERFKPDVAVGVGGYASGPILRVAGKRGIPYIIQEQNSYAGLTNRILAKRAAAICVAYPDMEKFFPKDKIIITGNPIRDGISPATPSLKERAKEHFNLDTNKKTLLIIGGSLGAGTLNHCIRRWLFDNKESDMNIIWQCGRYYFKDVEAFNNENIRSFVKYFEFITSMDLAFAAADLVISRAGAGTISELCMAGKATIFVPSPNVAEDHQTHNAMALVKRGAACMVADIDAEFKLMKLAEELIFDDDKIAGLEKNILSMAIEESAERIAYEILKYEKREPTTRNESRAELVRTIPSREEDNSKAVNIYLIGIGGIGMSALARFYKNEGCLVAGYDRTPSKLTRELEAEGIAVHYEESVAAIPEICKEEKDRTLVIYTPAIPADMEEMVYFRNNGYKMVKRSAALGVLAENKRCLAVAGTHGKTTTSTLLAHILTHSGAGCTAFLGGISKNYGSNFLLDKNRLTSDGYASNSDNETMRNNSAYNDNGLLVAEADEFDRSFLQLFPEVAIITSTDADHLDIYGNHETILEAFSEFASQVKRGGTLILKNRIELPNREKIAAKIQSYSYEDSSADFYASNIELGSGGFFHFDIVYPGGVIEGCTLGIPGWVNVENAIAASAVAIVIGIEPSRIKAALASFAGIGRRFDIRVNTPECAYIDDYAHHPSEIAASISSIRNIFPKRRLTGIFQPHLYTRTRDFAVGFAESLSKLDELIMLDIYPARELPIEGISSKIILDNVTIKDKMLITKERLMEEISSKDRDIIITLGAGDIDRFVEPITEYLEKRYNV